MEKRLSKILMIFTAYCCVLGACDPRDGNLPAWESEFLMPLINADFDFRDITLNGDLELREDSAGALSIVYVSKKDSIRLSDFLDIPVLSTDIELPQIPNMIDDIHLSEKITAGDLGLSFGINIFVPPFNAPTVNEQADITEYFIEAVFGSGRMDLTIKNGFPFAIDQGVVIEIANADDNSIIVTHTTTSAIAANSNYTFDELAELTGKRMSGNLKIKLSNISSPGASNVQVTPDTYLGVELSITDLTLKQATLMIPPFESPSKEELFTFDLPFGAKLTTIYLKSGLLEGAIESNIGFPVTVEVVMTSITKDAIPVNTAIDLSREKKFTLDLSNTIFDLTAGGEREANTMAVSIKLSSQGSVEPVTVNFEDTATGSILISDLHPTAVFGYLGTYQSVLHGGVELDFFNPVVSGSINFQAPSIRAYINNELGFSAGFIDNENLYVKGSNHNLFPDKEVSLTEALKDVKIERAQFPGDRKQSVIVLNGHNEPRFAEFIGLLPNQVDFSFPVRLGSEEEELTQFAIDSSGISGHIEVEFPLAFRARDLTMTDTLDLDVTFENEYGEVLSGELHSYVTNHFPIELLLQVYFLNDSLQVLDSMFVERRIIAAGKVNDEGKVVEPSKVNFVIGISGQKLENLSNSTFAKPVFVLNTTEQQDVKVYSDSRVNFKVNGDFIINLKNE